MKRDRWNEKRVEQCSVAEESRIEYQGAVDEVPDACAREVVCSEIEGV